jgi:hypothetical protein
MENNRKHPNASTLAAVFDTNYSSPAMRAGKKALGINEIL